MTELELANLLSTHRWTIKQFSSMGNYWWWYRRESTGTRLVLEKDIPWQHPTLRGTLNT